MALIACVGMFVPGTVVSRTRFGVGTGLHMRIDMQRTVDVLVVMLAWKQPLAKFGTPRANVAECSGGAVEPSRRGR